MPTGLSAGALSTADLSFTLSLSSDLRSGPVGVGGSVGTGACATASDAVPTELDV